MRPSTAVLTSIVLFAWPASASAATPGPGGLEAPGKPSISAVMCSDGRVAECSRGDEMRIAGENLQAIERVRFLGGRGRDDDRVARPVQVNHDELSVRVPARTRSGPVEIRGGSGSARAATVRISTTTLSAEAGDDSLLETDAVFPVRGAHDYGTSINRFGGGRGHQGQDVFAECGTPLVAAMPGRVIKATYQSRAGNYVVIQHADGRSTAYMHMRRPALVETGDRVLAGDEIGETGETGRASGCHLHFELWTAPGWYRGGRAVDPLGALRAMDERRSP